MHQLKVKMRFDNLSLTNRLFPFPLLKGISYLSDTYSDRYYIFKSILVDLKLVLFAWLLLWKLRKDKSFQIIISLGFCICRGTHSKCISSCLLCNEVLNMVQYILRYTYWAFDEMVDTVYFLRDNIFTRFANTNL